MGMNIRVYKSSRIGDCTMDGVSSKFDTLCVVNVSGPFEPDGRAAAVLLERHVPGCLRLVPAVPAPNGEWVRVKAAVMMGGNYGATSDSRFTEACERLLGQRFYGAVAIHDRIEA